MNFLARIFGRPQLRNLANGRGWIVDVVGESYFQENLSAQHRAHNGGEHDIKVVAALIPEPTNRYDSNAVRVEIRKRPVGYLTREMAVEYRAALGVAAGQCRAKIVGGFLLDDGTRAHFGVKLNLAWPPRFES